MAQGGGAPPSEWDYIWTYTDGMPTVGGWERLTTGGTNSMTSPGLKLIANQYGWSTGVTNGIIEAKFQIINAKESMAENRALLRIGDASNSVTVIFKTYNGHHIRLYNNSTEHYGTDLGTFTLGAWYVVRLEISGSTGVVIIDGTTVKDNVNAASMYSKGNPMFGGVSSYGGSVWEYVKIKDNSGV